jgi:hypothetical protein
VLHLPLQGHGRHNRDGEELTLEKPEVEQGFILSCQARPTSGRVVVSFDER